LSGLLDTIKSLPDSAGVYQYLDARGRVLYIGKAKSLKKRVKSYWRFTPKLHPNPNLSPRILKMLSETKELSYIVVDSEADALILENSLIKQLKPKYNILLRDDKTYPYIYIDESKEFPRFEITRKVIDRKGVKYYGPFPTGAKELLDAIYLFFPLIQRRGSLKNKKACLFYQIGRCLAPCEGKISSSEYKKIVAKAKGALENLDSLIELLKSKMLSLAESERFEEAIKLRDAIDKISKLELYSNIDNASLENLDIFAIEHNGVNGVILRLFVRNKRVSATSYSYFKGELANLDEAYRQAILDYYKPDTPKSAKSLLLAHNLDDMRDIEDTLNRLLGYKMRVYHPKRGAKAKLIDLAIKNAKELLEKRGAKEDIEDKIVELFKLSSYLNRVEIFDNSHLMGEATVGAMVVYQNGKWLKSAYRQYRLSSKDEYNQMRELLIKRANSFDKEPPPDLWLIDGGETLRVLAKEILNSVGVNIDVIAIAKEKIDIKANRAKGLAKDIIYSDIGVIKLDAKDVRLQFLQKLRDEAHRFALNYHKKLKIKEDKRVKLLEKKGIGKATIKRLLDYFGTFEAIKEANKEELSLVVGKKVAKILKE